MPRKRKMCFRDFDSFGIHFVDAQRVKNSVGQSGWRYVLDKPLTEDQKSIISGFKNTIIGTVRHRYAPEILHDTVILTDKCQEVGIC